MTALKLLAKKKRIAANYEVPCLLVVDASARTVSLAENVQRENMHPADQFAAFAALVKEGRPVEDIAADFGVTPLVVQRRLKLANVSPRLLADYRAGAATLEQLMALTVTDDHAAQEAAFYGAPEWQRQPSALRDRLTERVINAAHPLVRVAGLDAYTETGGGIRRDLFAEGDAGTYLTDAALLETLVRAKLDAQAEEVRAEGWAWVEAVPNMSHADRQTFQNAPRQRRELHDKGFLIVDGTDGRAHYVALPLRSELDQYPSGAVVEVKDSTDVRAADRNIAALAVDGMYRTDHHLAVAQGQATPDRDPREVVAAHVRRLEALRRAGIVEREAEGVWRVPGDLAERGRQYDAQRLGGGVAVELKSHLPIERQARVIGATWLDQQLIGGGKRFGDLGFGAEVKDALRQRADFLAEQGLADHGGQRVVLARNLLATLRGRELAKAGQDIAGETGLEHRPVADGQRVAGVYRRSVMLASRRFAMLDDGMGFSLVPWKPVIEQRLGQQLAATMRGGVSWEIGRQRGPAIG
ncbi:DUF3363 domain-containing protein [Paraburkholderia sp. BL25I1N1]|uniref:DUF3363 domain-containing protein n=1 Tax=Paraburkholderia sp. BL25I1N1 TaxID=1938804 RepID=UPI00215920B3|nr:DUF3363 domain-containing protein [Paraburkholderia sp. BL25I1N1]